MLSPKQSGEGYGYVPTKRGVDSVLESALEIVPIIMSLFQPKSVLDIGCGAGDWLSAFFRNGVANITGYDGDWVPADSLRIPNECFYKINFYESLPKHGRADLALCLEVAEHLDSKLGMELVNYLCESADVVCWSAAVPGQGGYQHINERWQQYWVDLFAKNNFRAFDLIRPLIWNNEKVHWWYKQNLLVFANDVAKETHNLAYKPICASLVHPFLYERNSNPHNYSIKSMLRLTPFYLRLSARRAFDAIIKSRRK